MRNKTPKKQQSFYGKSKLEIILEEDGEMTQRGGNIEMIPTHLPSTPVKVSQKVRPSKGEERVSRAEKYRYRFRGQPVVQISEEQVKMEQVRD